MCAPMFSTQNLFLRPLAISDADAVQKVFQNWETVQYLSAKIPWPYPSDGALALIRDVVLPAASAGCEWHWSIRLRSEPERLIGVISLMDKANCNRAFWLAPRWRSRGFMLEASNAATQYWFTDLDRPTLREPKAAANEASRRLSQQIGMRIVHVGEQSFVSGRLPSELWEITQEGLAPILFIPCDKSHINSLEGLIV